jgi:hypothetical protein
MKYGYLFPLAALFFIAATGKQHFTLVQQNVFTGSQGSQSIRFLNESRLKNLPAILNRLSVVLNEEAPELNKWLAGDGFSVRIFDISCESFEHVAAIRYQARDSVFQLKLNAFNQHASDRALAATLIHETMHCILLHTLKRVQQGDKNALQQIADLGLAQPDSSNAYSNQFFVLVNQGQEGQHEMMYQLLYPTMVALLQRFIEIHEGVSVNPSVAEYLMWSGLQGTKAYKSLDPEEQKQIESTLLSAKGVLRDGFE